MEVPTKPLPLSAAVSSSSPTLFSRARKIKKRQFAQWGLALVTVVGGQMDWPKPVLLVPAVGALLCFAFGAYKWGGEFNYRIRGTSQQTLLRWALASLVTLSAGLAFGTYLRVFPTWTDEREARLQRYQRFYENSDAPNKTTLIEMTNVELKTRCANLLQRMNAMMSHFGTQDGQLKGRFYAKEITQAEYEKRYSALEAAVAREFEAKYRVEARMLLLEFRNRIAPENRKHIVGMGGFKSSDPRDGTVSLYDIFPSTFGFYFSEQLARELQELSKLLPDD
jgi:hypothetical protein